MPIHIFHLINSLARGGAEKVVTQIVKNSPSDVNHTVCYFGGDDSLAKTIRQSGAQVISLDSSFHYNPRALWQLRQTLKDIDPDVLHLHLPVSIWVGRVIGNLSGINNIISTHHSVPENYQLFSRTLEKATREIDDKTVSVSKHVGEAVSAGADNQITIYNGIDASEFMKEAEKMSEPSVYDDLGLENSEVFLNVGRYTPIKSQKDIIEAMGKVIEKYPQAHLLLVGWGELEKELKEYAKKLGYSEHVSIVGPTSEVQKYYKISDVFILSSEKEGFGIVLLEAMAAQLPTVATNLPAIREIVNEGETGSIVGINNSEQMGEEMIRCYENKETLGQNGQKRVEQHFSVERMVNQYHSLYNSLVIGK